MTTACRLLSLAALGLLLTGLPACQSEGPERGATVSQLSDDPQQYFGQNVTVSGEVGQVLGDASFTLGGDAFGDRLVVYISPSATLYGQGNRPDSSFAEGDIVQVTGQVRPYVDVSAEQEGQSQSADISYEDQAPALLASALYLTPRVARAGRPADTSAAVASDSLPAADTAGGAMQQ